MSKWITREASNGRFVIGRSSAEKFSAVEGQDYSPRTGKLVKESDKSGESGDERRKRIRAEFSSKK